MEYILYANIGDEITKIGDEVIKILKSDKVFGEVSSIKSISSEIECCCDVFNLFIYNSSDTIQYISEESNLALNIGFFMNLNTQCEDVVAKTIYFVGKVMKEFSGNIVLMQNGDTPILVRNGTDVTIDKSGLPSFYPFEMLETKYKINNIDFC